MHTPLGYDPHNVMSVGIPVHDGTYKTWAERSAYFDQLQKKVATVPGVDHDGDLDQCHAAFQWISDTHGDPGQGGAGRAEGAGQLGEPRVLSGAAYSAGAGADLGRDGEPQCSARGGHQRDDGAAVLPQRRCAGPFAEDARTDGRATFQLTAPDGAGWLQIVGVIADKRDDGLRKPIQPEVFVPYTLSMRMGTQILVRSEVSPLSLLHAVAAQVNSVDPDQQINGQVQDLEHWITNQPEMAAGAPGGVALRRVCGAGLALAAVGLYSVVSYSVAQRTNEFGIRMALGAQRSHVLRIVFASTVVSVGGGMAAGLVLTLSLNRVLAHWAEGSSRDPLIVVAAALLLSLVAFVACAVPARRASRVDPALALRR